MDDYYDEENSKFKGKRWRASDWTKKQTRSAMDAELDRRKAWYDGRKDVTPQSKLTEEQRGAQDQALQKCLDCGALTWGDYDTLIRKLHGEEDVSTIAETLEWVNVLLAMLWQPVDRYLSDWTQGPLKDFINMTVSAFKKYGLKCVTIGK
eukprot:gene7882-1455_t